MDSINEEELEDVSLSSSLPKGGREEERLTLREGTLRPLYARRCVFRGGKYAPTTRLAIDSWVSCPSLNHIHFARYNTSNWQE
jgi:hypothetical protein